MQIGNCVLYDKGTKEGRLVTVIGGNATIMTQSGPVTWPLTDVSEAPVRVVELTDEVGAEEEMEIVQYPAPEYERVKFDDLPKELQKTPPPGYDGPCPPIEPDDADTESHQADLAAEEAAPPRQDAVDPETGVETPPAPPASPVAPQAPPAPPGQRPGVLDGFKSPQMPEEVQELAAQVNQPEEPVPQTHTTTGAPAEPENIDVESVELPKRFGSTWLAKQDPAFLRALLNRKDLTKGRLASIRDELDRRQAT